MRRGELAGTASPSAPACQMRAVGREAVDHGVAVAVGHIEVAAGSDRDIGRMVEGRLRARAVPLAERQQQPAFRVEGEHLVRVPVHDKDAPVRSRRDAVRVRDLAVAQLRTKFPCASNTSTGVERRWQM